MPIRINLLAEAQALEELRRRDPVKRAIWISVFAGFLVLLYSSSLWVKAFVAKSDLAREEAAINLTTNKYRVVLENEKKLKEMDRKLDKLTQLATNRFLNGTLLNALQQSVIDDVQLTRLRTEHVYALIEGTKAKTNAPDRIIPGRPATVTEKIVLTLEARDSSANPGDQVTKFKDTLTDSPYFQKVLGKTNQVRLVSHNPEQPGPDGKSYVQFTLECRLPDKTR